MSNLRTCLALSVTFLFIAQIPTKAFSMEGNNPSATQSSFWDLKPFNSDQLGCHLEENKNLQWCKFLSHLISLESGVAFIKRNENNERQVQMLESGLSHAMFTLPSVGTEDFITLKNEYPKIQILHSTTVHLSYGDIKEMCVNAGMVGATTPIIYSVQKGANMMQRFYPALCKKIDNEMKQGKDGTMLGYKFKVMVPPIDTATHEAEVEFYVFSGK